MDCKGGRCQARPNVGGVELLDARSAKESSNGASLPSEEFLVAVPARCPDPWILGRLLVLQLAG
jgi:hypothetical protein